MTKPDDMPQWAWDAAERHLRPDQFGIMQPAQVLLARVAIEAERRGMERAAEIADGLLNDDTMNHGGYISRAIRRAATKETKPRSI